MGVRWVIGDIHGCAGKLEALLRAIRFDRHDDELWSIGDLVNKGPDSLAVLRLWVDTGARGVIGNHDRYALRVHSGRRKRRPDTLDELLAAPDVDDLLAAVRALPHDDRWLKSPATAFATGARCCDPAGEISDHVGPPAECTPPFRPWDTYYRGTDRVVHGHWALRGHHRTGKVIGLDSGCVYGGKLTAWCQEEDRVVQV